MVIKFFSFIISMGSHVHNHRQSTEKLHRRMLIPVFSTHTQTTPHSFPNNSFLILVTHQDQTIESYSMQPLGLSFLTEYDFLDTGPNCCVYQVFVPLCVYGVNASKYSF